MTTAHLGRFIHDCRPLLYRAALAATLLAAVGLLQAVVAPTAGELGPIRYTLTKSKPPLRLLSLFASLALLLHPRLRAGAAGAWRRAWDRADQLPWGWRIAFLLAAAHLAVSLRTLAPLPDEIRRSLRSAPGNYGNVFSTYHFSEEFAHSFAACFEGLPADARVLYRGGHEATRIAYLAFPRRIFMLPQERYWATIEVQDCYDVHQRPPDPLFPSRYRPPAEIEAAEFCRQRRITHEIRLVGERWECRRWEESP